MNIAVADPGAITGPAQPECALPLWPRDVCRFRTAMLADIRLSPYGEPDVTLSSYKTWLIVQRRGMGGTVLTVGLAGEENVNGRKAPLRLRAITTRHARLFSQSAATSEFLFHRSLPADEAVDGVFEPCEGYARMECSPRGFKLTAFGRMANRALRHGGGAVLAEAEEAAGREGVSWRISAVRKPWAGESIGV